MSGKNYITLRSSVVKNHLHSMRISSIIAISYHHHNTICIYNTLSLLFLPSLSYTQGVT